MKAVVRSLVFFLLTLCSLEATAQQVPITRYARFTGNVNFVATGGSLRTQSDSGDSCAVGSTSTRALTGVPVGASIVAAYLYWGGSGTTADSSVTLNGSPITATRTFQAVYNNAGTNLPFFGGFADVTTRVSGNATFTFGELTVNTGTPHCGVAAVQAGWGLIAIYGSPSERLRAINVFDGLQYFRGSSLTLTPNGFRVPATNIDGRVAVITWEGDPANSNSLNGFSEALRFNGTLLNDGIVPPGSDPSFQQYDGTVNSAGVANSYGVDVDTYDVSALLSPGQTSASTQYSAGGDLVLLAAQIVSATSEPIVDLALSKTHSGNFTVGTNAAYTLVASSEPGSQQTDFPIVVTDTLPAGLSYVSASGSGWSCGASGQLVTCTHAGPLNAGASLPAITLNVAVGNAAWPSVSNTAQVTTPSNDPVSANNSATDVATVLGSNLSTSAKTVQDLNGGDANPGDTLRYTITLTESAGVAATAVSVTDDVPANVSGFNVIGIPGGASNASTGDGTGANGTGYLNVTGISVPANGSATVTFDVQVAAGATPGATIDNTATIDNPGGVDATPSAPQVIVSASSIPGSGTKPLYLWSNPDRRLSRTPPSGTHNSVNIDGAGASATWTMTPALQTPLTLQAGGMAVRLWLTNSGTGTSRTITVRLTNSALGSIASVGPLGISPPDSGPAESVFTLNIPSSITAPAGSTFSLVVTNNTTQSDRDINVFPISAGNISRVELQSATVINVDSVQAFTAPYPGGTLATNFTRGSTVYVRSVVSDPFGSFDIAGANITILDSASNAAVSNAAMTQAFDSGNSTRTYEYAFVVPVNAALGAWTTRVIAREGTENAVTDLGLGTFQVVMPSLQVQKLSEVLSDPVNGNSDPKRIPGSILRYSIIVTNAGAGSVDASSLNLTDAIPAGLAVYASTASGAPIEFVDGSIASGLSFSYAADVRYSNQPGGGPPYVYTPLPGPDGFDPAITGVRIAPAGTMAGASGASTPSFTVRFVVRVE
jgi:trimeric autotransporter adhesin